jgi:hypothetical protein
MTLLKYISASRGSTGGSEGEEMSAIDVVRCLEVFEKCSKVKNPGQIIGTALPHHADIHTLYGLAYACPHIDRKDNCPLKAIELLPFKEKVVWINGLSKEEKEIILEHHKACSIKR